MLRAFCQGLVTGWTSILGLSGGLLARLARVVSLGAIAGCLERWGAVGAGHGVRLGLGILVAHRTCADPSRAHAQTHTDIQTHTHTGERRTDTGSHTHTHHKRHTHARSHTHIQLAMPRGPLAMGKYSLTKSEEDSGHVHM
jgi:hypothetical protein